MIYVAHRINTIKQLKEVPAEYGVEVDIRDSNGRLIMVHDPLSKGEDFEKFLFYYSHKLIILNIKSERVEYKVLELLKKYQIKNYFFLDCSFPMIYTLSEMGEKNIAARFSELEPIENVLAIKDRIKWIWIDCFSKFPVDEKMYEIIKKTGLKTCLVSPELQGKYVDIDEYVDFIKSRKMKFDAVCTKQKNIESWKERMR
jgi:hypothetical protein